MRTISPQLKRRTGRGILAGRIVGQRIFKISIFRTQHYCANTTVMGDLQWTGIHDAKATTLCLNGATIKSLRDERESWPVRGAYAWMDSPMKS